MAHMTCICNFCMCVKKDVNTKSNGEENFIVFKQLYTGLMVMVVVIYQFLKSVVKLEYLITPRSIRI